MNQRIPLANRKMIRSFFSGGETVDSTCPKDRPPATGVNLQPGMDNASTRQSPIIRLS